MSTAPFPVDPVLTGIALAYMNRRFIADDVLPRIEPRMDAEEFQYWKFNLEEGFTVPDTKVGRKSLPNEVEFNATELTDKTEDYGLDDVIPNKDTTQGARAGFDPAEHATEMLTELVELDRERRVAGLVHNAATYPVGNKVTLAGVDQWSDFVNSDPIDDIQTGLDTPIIRPNIGVIGRLAFSTLSRHPKVVKAVHGNDGDSGIARRAQIAELFELDDIFVGESFINSAKKGQTANLGRIWGNHMSLLWRDPLSMGTKDRVTFGATFQFGERVAGRIPEPKIGLYGSERVRVGESVKEKILAEDVGYFIENAI